MQINLEIPYIKGVFKEFMKKILLFHFSRLFKVLSVVYVDEYINIHAFIL